MPITVLRTQIEDEKSLSADFTAPSSGLNISQYSTYRIQVIRTNAGTSVGNFKLQTAADNSDTTYFVDYSGSTRAFDSATDVTVMWEVTVTGPGYVRVSWDNTAGTGGTVDIIAFLKTDG